MNVQVIQTKTLEKHGYTAMQLGLGSKRAKRMPASQRGQFVEAGLPFKRKLAEFRVRSYSSLLHLTSHFVAILMNPLC